MNQQTNSEEVLTYPEGIPIIDPHINPSLKPAPELLIITGMSGAGRSQAGQALEDLDWYVVDNLPPAMLIPFADMMTAEGEGVHRLAAIVDVRSGDLFDRFASVLDDLAGRDLKYRLLFLEAKDDVLVRRYESNRRPHPLQSQGTIMQGIAREKEILAPIRQRADVIIDTSSKNIHDLARHMRDVVAGEADRPLKLTVMSFGFKHGIPLDADWVIDVRFLANPYWEENLRNLTGQDLAVSEYVLNQPGAREFGSSLFHTLYPILGGYLNELKPCVTVAIGCTGGKHRSVALTEYISSRFREIDLPVRTVHRDIEKE